MARTRWVHRQCKEKMMWDSAVGVIVTLTLSLLAEPLTVTAQPRSTVPRIGILAPGGVGSPAWNRTDPWWEAFQQGLRDLGYVEGQNIRIEYRSGEIQDERLLALATELVRLPVEVLAAAAPGAVAAKQATATIPIVFAVFADPLAEGLVASLARPGGNVTGFSLLAHDLAAKRVELLTTVVPGLRRIAVLWNRHRPGHASQIHEIQAASGGGGV